MSLAVVRLREQVDTIAFSNNKLARFAFRSSGRDLDRSMNGNVEGEIDGVEDAGDN